MIALFQLFGSYEQEECKSNAFNTFFCLSLTSLLAPHFIYFCVVFLIGMITFRSISFQTFLTGLIGVILPYWFLFGYAFLTDEMGLFYQPFHEMTSLPAINYQVFSVSQWIAMGIVAAYGAISSVYYLTVSNQDKTRVRILLSFLIFLEVCILAFFLVLPQYFIPLFILQSFITSLLTSHLLVLSRTRFSLIIFISVLVVWTLWALFSVFFESTFVV